MAVQQESMLDRYVAAVLERVPQEQRAAAATQLREAIAQGLADQQATGVPRHEAEQAVLAELGDPIRYAARHGGRPAHLIGPAFFPFYWRLLRLVLAIAVPIVTVVVVLSEAAAGSDPWQVVVSAAGVAFDAGVQVAFWITLVFAVLDRTGSPAPSWEPSQLPHVRQHRIGLFDTVISVVMMTVLIVLLLWQRDNGVVVSAGDEPLPLINPDLWGFWMPALILVLLASIVLELVKFRTGRWTVPLAVVNTVLNAAFIAIVLVLGSRGDVLNPALSVPEGVAPGLWVLAWTLVLIAVWDAAEGWWRLARGEGNPVANG